ncbi:MAG: glycosyltransferase family 2 protein [Thermodesulfobacteriota bacterium]
MISKKNKPTVSVVICTKDRFAELLRFFPSLDSQSLLPDEVLVVDASAGDETRDLVSAKNASGVQYELCHIKAAPGMTRQRNIGLDRSRGDIVLFFDDDVVLEPDCLLYLHRAFIEQSGQGLGGVTGRIVNVPEKRNAAEHLFKKAFFLSEIGSGRMKPSGFPEHRVGGEPGFVEVVSGCCMAFDREALLRHRFDETLAGYCYMEDVDISRRLTAGGYRLYYEPRARLSHFSTTHQRADARKLARMLARNHAYFFRKNSRKDPAHVLAFAWSVAGLFAFNIWRRNPRALQGIAEGLWDFAGELTGKAP